MDIAHTYPAGYGTSFPILGLYLNYNNIIEIMDGNQKIITNIQTTNISIRAATIKKDILPQGNDPFNMELYWTDSTDLNGVTYVTAYDRLGDVRFLMNIVLEKNTVVNYYVRTLMTNGEILVQFLTGTKTLTGQSRVTFPDSISYHHDVTPVNNNFVILANTGNKTGAEDRIVEIDSGNRVVKDLQLGELFRKIVKAPGELDTLNKIVYDSKNPYFNSGGQDSVIDWAHANASVYDKDNDIMYISLRHLGVIAVKWDSYELLWWMADNSLRTKKGVDFGQVPNPELTFKDIPSLAPYQVRGDAVDKGPKNQHVLILYRDNNLGMFDNQGDAPENPSGSRYVQYEITGAKGSWSARITREYRDSIYSRVRSDIDILPNNNLLMTYGINKIIREVNNGEILYEMQINSEAVIYRGDKFPLYPFQDSSKKYGIDSNQKIEL